MCSMVVWLGQPDSFRSPGIVSPLKYKELCYTGKKKDQQRFYGRLQYCLLYINILPLVCLNFGTSVSRPKMDCFIYS